MTPIQLIARKWAIHCFKEAAEWQAQKPDVEGAIVSAIEEFMKTDQNETWEYITIYLRQHETDTFMNQWGAKGWEAYAVSDTDGNDTPRIWFKRRKKDK